MLSHCILSSWWLTRFNWLRVWCGVGFVLGYFSSLMKQYAALLHIEGWKILNGMARRGFDSQEYYIELNQITKQRHAITIFRTSILLVLVSIYKQLYPK